MNHEELMALRQKILDSVRPLVIDSVESTPDRFTLLLRLIQSGSTEGELYKKAYECAAAIEDKDEKLAALMALLDEIDFDLAEESQTGTEQASQEQVA